MPDRIQPRNGYYTATEARLLLGRSRVSFAALVKSQPALLERRVKNSSDGRSWLYPADLIDELRKRALPTSTQHAPVE